jgi:hypothetical protein
MRRIYLILVSIGFVLATFATPVFLTGQASLKAFNTATAAIVIDQTIPGLGNKIAIQISKKSPLVQTATQALIQSAEKISNRKLRSATVDAISNRKTCVQHRIGISDSTKQSILQQLTQASLVDSISARTFPGGLKAGVFPPLLKESSNCPQLPQAFFSSPGSAFGGHHSAPGGLPIHEFVNDLSGLGLTDVYRQAYGTSNQAGLPIVSGNKVSAQKSDVSIDQDLMIAAPIWHDWAKTLVFQWNADGTEFQELNFGGNGISDNKGTAGDSRTGGHHILGLAESIKRGLSPAFVITQASAHAAPSLGNEYKVVNWIRTAAIVAQIDPVATGYLSKDSQSNFRLPPLRRLGDVDLNAAGQTNLLVEYALHNLSDADFVFTIPAVSIDQVILKSLASEFGYDANNVSPYNNQFRNPIFSYLSAERLAIIYGNKGLSGVRAELQNLKRLNII